MSAWALKFNNKDKYVYVKSFAICTCNKSNPKWDLCLCAASGYYELDTKWEKFKKDSIKEMNDILKSLGKG